MKDNEKIAAVECLKEVLESYMDFINIVLHEDDKVLPMAEHAIRKWNPVLVRVTEDLKDIND